MDNYNEKDNDEKQTALMMMSRQKDWKVNGFAAFSETGPQGGNLGEAQSLSGFPRWLPQEAIPKRILSRFFSFKYFHKNIYGKYSWLLPKEILKGKLK